MSGAGRRPEAPTGRPAGRVSSPLGASRTLDDGWASPSHPLLPSGLDTRSRWVIISEIWYKWAKTAGYRLLRHPRIAEIEAETARLHSRTDEVLVGKLENVYRRAVVDHQFHAAARAVDLQARIRGFIAPAALRADAEAEDEADTWPAPRPADGGRRFRAPARGDLRRSRRGGVDLGGY